MKRKTKRKEVVWQEKAQAKEYQFSAYVITKNEPHYVDGCIMSVADMDEIVVLDTGSKNLDYAKSFDSKIKFHVMSNKDFVMDGLFNFGMARNEAKGLCAKDYILAIDTDERLVDHGLREFVKANPADGYTMHIVSPHVQLAPLSIMVESVFTRVFKNDKETFYINPVHENVVYSITLRGGKIVEIPKKVAYIAHLGYDISREAMLDKMKRNTALAMWILKKNPGDAYTWFSVARTFAMLGEYKEFEDALNYALKLGITSPLRERAIRYLQEYDEKKKIIQRQTGFWKQYYGR